MAITMTKHDVVHTEKCFKSWEIMKRQFSISNSVAALFRSHNNKEDFPYAFRSKKIRRKRKNEQDPILGHHYKS